MPCFTTALQLICQRVREEDPRSTKPTPFDHQIKKADTWRAEKHPSFATIARPFLCAVCTLPVEAQHTDHLSRLMVAFTDVEVQICLLHKQRHPLRGVKSEEHVTGRHSLRALGALRNLSLVHFQKWHVKSESTVACSSSSTVFAMVEVLTRCVRHRQVEGLCPMCSGQTRKTSQRGV